MNKFVLCLPLFLAFQIAPSLAEEPPVQAKPRSKGVEDALKIVYKGHRLNLDGYDEAPRNHAESKARDLENVRKQAEKNLLATQIDEKAIGKPAVNPMYKLMDGGVLDLNQYKDKKIVVLGFWGLPCIDCVLPLPYWADIADRYKDKDVAVITVDFRDGDEKQVRAFLAKQDFKLPVAMKPQLGGPYMLDHRRPLTYVIGKDGLIKSVHMLLHEEIVPVVSKELDALLDGKELLASKPANAAAEPPKK